MSRCTWGRVWSWAGMLHGVLREGSALAPLGMWSGAAPEKQIHYTTSRTTMTCLTSRPATAITVTAVMSKKMTNEKRG